MQIILLISFVPLAGQDSLYGDAGDDTLNGGLPTTTPGDTCEGGTGTDTCTNCESGGC